ncbi:hypothetical protein [Chryseobacterium sp. c4a]|uniref:hypothetical protein n=1 Tax=Chryseobacterium sp. c4a TaxID=1573582 RepID=UPI001356B1C7|nr:hypothetical protein [Chryseobacterium sp. c4a]
MENIKFNAAGKYTFLISSGLGTFLFLLFFITQNEFLLLLGFICVVFAVLVNTLIFLHLLIVFLSDISEEKAAGNSILLLLLNIPIALLYFYILF